MSKRMNGRARPRRGHPSAFKNYDDDANMHESMLGFLQSIWRGAAKDSYFFVATSTPDGSGWREHLIHAHNTTVDLNIFLNEHSRWDYNLYFCPNPFSRDRRKKEFARPSRLGWCDMDESDPDAYQPGASLVWETSPGRYQALWLWDARHNTEEAEGYSRSLAEQYGGDSGWTITKMLRIPGSVNHKPEYDEPIVRLIWKDWNRIDRRPRLPEVLNALDAGDLVDPDAHEPRDVLEKYRRSLHLKVRTLIKDKHARERDRSGCIYLMVAGLHEAGASPDEIASVIWKSPYFIDKHGQHLDRLDAEITRILGKLGGAR